MNPRTILGEPGGGGMPPPPAKAKPCAPAVKGKCTRSLSIIFPLYGYGALRVVIRGGKGRRGFPPEGLVAVIKVIILLLS